MRIWNYKTAAVASLAASTLLAGAFLPEQASALIGALPPALTTVGDGIGVIAKSAKIVEELRAPLEAVLLIAIASLHLALILKHRDKDQKLNKAERIIVALYIGVIFLNTSLVCMVCVAHTA